MGNVASCAPSMVSNGATKLLHSNGKLQIYTKPIKAGDIMVENPGEFVCDFSSLKVGQRIQGLSADEELQRRRQVIYFLLPMDLLYSVLTHEEMRILSFKANKALKHTYLKSLIMPVLMSSEHNQFCIFPQSSEIKREDEQTKPLDLDRSFSHQTSWKPALETITETPPRSL